MRDLICHPKWFLLGALGCATLAAALPAEGRVILRNSSQRNMQLTLGEAGKGTLRVTTELSTGGTTVETQAPGETAVFELISGARLIFEFIGDEPVQSRSGSLEELGSAGREGNAVFLQGGAAGSRLELAGAGAYKRSKDQRQVDIVDPKPACAIL